MPKRIDLTDKVFGRWKVIRFSYKDKNGGLYYICQCVCGVEKRIFSGNLSSGHSKSCGCGENKRAFIDGRSNEPLISIWYAMLERCYNKNGASYKNYGGRGITVCQRWRDSVKNFYADIGKRPSAKHSIDRIDKIGRAHY